MLPWAGSALNHGRMWYIGRECCVLSFRHQLWLLLLPTKTSFPFYTTCFLYSPCVILLSLASLSSMLATAVVLAVRRSVYLWEDGKYFYIYFLQLPVLSKH